MFNVAFICEANVCRSPLMQLVFASKVDPNEWKVNSFGTRPTFGRICDVTAEIVNRSEANEHRGRSIKELNIETHDLIITASRRERGIVSALAPHARWRIFTLREAIALAATEVDEAERDEEPALAISGGLRHFASILHLRRGFITPARNIGRAPVKLEWDIIDAHGLRPTQHRKILREAARDTLTLHERIAVFLGGDSTGSQGRSRPGGVQLPGNPVYDNNDATASATDCR